MPFKFTNQPLQQGLYEPEGIYLHLPFAGAGVVLQPYGIQDQRYEHLTYNGSPLKGHNGVDFGIEPSTELLAVDDGRVVELSYDIAGLGRYIKLVHRWGESLYAVIGEATIDSGHHVERGEVLGRGSGERLPNMSWALLHFGVRILPYNRYDGWGGYANPLTYFSADDIRFPEQHELANISLPLHRLQEEQKGMRRP